MQQRPPVVLDDAYYRFDDPRHAAVYEDDSFGQNRADSIWWACCRCRDDAEVRDFIFDMRRELRSIIAGLPSHAFFVEMLAGGADPNSFFVLLGNFTEAKHPAVLRRWATEACLTLKRELNLDLLQGHFRAERSYSKKPERTAIRLPG
jgi:hypothetical protein